MFRHIAENIIKKSLHSQFVNEIIPCYGYKYLSILTDGDFNPDPTGGAVSRLNHYFILKDSNRLFPIYGEMRNIPIGKNKEIRYWNRKADYAGFNELENGYGNIIFYLSNYLNDFMSLKGNIGFQWEHSWTQTTDTTAEFHLGINKLSAIHELAIPFIADCFNKLIYLFKESNLSQNAMIMFYYEDGDTHTENLAKDTLTELLLPSKRFKLLFQANAINPTDFDFMLKFEKA